MMIVDIIAVQQLRASRSLPRASVTKQYNLVATKDRWRYAAGKLTAVLVNSTAPPRRRVYDWRIVPWCHSRVVCPETGVSSGHTTVDTRFQPRDYL